MKIPLLMTGATGLVGSRFVEMFSDKYEIFNMDLTTNVDITNKETIEKFATEHPADALIHLAAFTNTNEAFKQNGDKEGICYKVNVLGTQNIAEVCKAHNIHMVHISTDFVFDGEKEDGYSEDDPTSPIEWYGETKAMAEDVVAKSGVSYTIARIAYPYRATFELKPDLVKKIRAGLETNALYPQFGDTIITPTLIDDIARGFDVFVNNKPVGVFHLVGSDSMSPYKFAQAVATAYGYDKNKVKEGSLSQYLVSNPRPFARYAKMSDEKFIKLAGWKPMTLAQGLAEIKRQQDLA
ncbi:MAG: SDR family oxidoreductase [bacterium]